MATEHVSQFARYAAVGLLGTAIHFLSTIALVEFNLLEPVAASMVGFSVTLVVSFILNSCWTFRSKGRSTARFLRYTVVSLFGLLLNALLMYAAVDWLQLNYLYGLAVVVMVIPPSNFLLNRYWSFRP